MRCQRGQATIEYVAIIAVLAILLAAAALATGTGAGIANAVVGQLRHALCIVTGGACPAEGRLPCVVATERDTRRASANILLVRLDGDRYVLRERLSDGTVRLTLAHAGAAGVEFGVGGRATIRRKGRAIGAQGEARGGAEGVLGYGETYIARDDEEADKILRDLRHRIPLVGGDGPDPSERFVDGGVRGLARLGIGNPLAGASLDTISDGNVSGRRDERTGNVTITMDGGSTGWALLSAVMSGPTGGLDRRVSFSVTLDRDHRPIALALGASGTLVAGAALPSWLARSLGVNDGDEPQFRMRGRHWELGARLDLTDPEVAAAWAAFRHDPADPDAIKALASAVRTRSYLDLRTYAASSESDGAAVGVSAGLRLGAEIDHTTDRTRLLAASIRPPGGAWEPRRDCVPA